MSDRNPSTLNESALRIGVLGGTFDPPHIGHLVIAQEALAHLRLERVIFAPTRNPPHKPNQVITPIEDRMEMVRLAIAGNPRLTLSRVDVDRAGPTYTVDTLRLLREQWGPQAEIYFIIGMDSLASILSWYHPEEMIKLCKLAVFKRPGFTADLEELERALPRLRERVVMIDAPALGVAASDLQRRVRNGEPIAHLVPHAVAVYIRDNGLYQNHL